MKHLISILLCVCLFCQICLAEEATKYPAKSPTLSKATEIASAPGSLLPEFFSEIAQLTLNSGNYADWTLDEKHYMMQVMNKYGMLDDAQADHLEHAPNDEIDHYILQVQPKCNEYHLPFGRFPKHVIDRYPLMWYNTK